MTEQMMRLVPVLDAAHAQALQGELLAHRGRGLVIDAEAVQRLSTPCLQVLASSAKTWAADGMALRIVNAPEAFMTAAGTLGLALPMEELA